MYIIHGFSFAHFFYDPVNYIINDSIQVCLKSNVKFVDVVSVNKWTNVTNIKIIKKNNAFDVVNECVHIGILFLSKSLI